MAHLRLYLLNRRQTVSRISPIGKCKIESNRLRRSCLFKTPLDAPFKKGHRCTFCRQSHNLSERPAHRSAALRGYTLAAQPFAPIMS